MTSPNPGSSRKDFTRLMRSSGHDGVLFLRTGGGSDAAPDHPRREGTAMTFPIPTRTDLQITGIRKHVAECVTPVEDAPCGARSDVWDSPRPLDVWIRAHADEHEHKKYVKHTEEAVNVFSRPAGERRA
ncbi:hypothetical protein [Streptomyces paromomycinus]|uniref:DUF7848 domain-containing protein n=1 Tax=Streptomyces paromomycinus TaxID=92743 RepID=A0A401W9H8_STREY|nr:hypothetical protein [Streptomyces paromomycinus]GCD45973.1 hypothetical protein GKJPGBOP_05716 [Streptomyces paromomycinus]